jgi:hypothetical protein
LIAVIAVAEWGRNYVGGEEQIVVATLP